jgi:hypothetical protein
MRLCPSLPIMTRLCDGTVQAGSLKFEAGIGIAGWTAGLLPEQRLIKPEVLRGIRFFPELPFATNPGGIARRLQKVREGRLRAGQGAKV